LGDKGGRRKGEPLKKGGGQLQVQRRKEGKGTSQQQQKIEISQERRTVGKLISSPLPTLKKDSFEQTTQTARKIKKERRNAPTGER